MTKEEIDKIILRGDSKKPELIETHISWVLLGEQFVFKIKKPIKYSFLDFSTLGNRQYYCKREIELNRRLTTGIYLDVQPVREIDGAAFIGGEKGDVIDYAVRMQKIDRSMQMDILLSNDNVSADDIRKLAKKIADFHKRTRVIHEKNLESFRTEFNDLSSEKKYLSEYLPPSVCGIIDQALGVSDRFLEQSRNFLNARLTEGFFRDCHGDLHTRNIFLLPDPQPFDCIEFNDDFRAIDVLNEVAFLCMDLDALERRDLSELFLRCYNIILPIANTEKDYRLFIYYKMYRANIRAKVNSLRARNAIDNSRTGTALVEVNKYLSLMGDYITMLNMQDI
jgi:aminoglycoside phosphotransferase family enzyme